MKQTHPKSHLKKQNKKNQKKAVKNKAEVKQQKKNKKSFFIISNVDKTLLFVTIILISFGIVMVYSSSSYFSLFKYDATDKLFIKQLIFIGVGMVVLLIFSYVNYQYVFSFWFVYYIVAVILLVYVLFFGVSFNDSFRWIKIPSTNITFQPSEIAKIFLLISNSVLLYRSRKKLDNLKWAIAIMIIGGIPIFLVAVADFSSAVILLMVFGGMYLLAAKHFLRDVFFVVAIGLSGIGTLKLLGKDVIQEVLFKKYRQRRFDIWWNGPFSDPSDEGMQVVQSLYAIGAGKFLGVGLGKSVQKVNKLPLPHNDVIFSVICEELGLLGGIGILFFFFVLIYKLYDLSKMTNNSYEKLFLFGLMIQIFGQVFVNVGTATNAVPATGIPLPFISYGGTAFLVIMAEMGIALNMSKQIHSRINKRYEDV